MSAQAALVAAVRRLRDAGVADPARDARLLLAYAMEIPSDRLTLHLPEPLSEGAQDRFEQALKRREARQPVSHILGRRLFLGREFFVTPDVLDPRPETETLVLRALEHPFATVLDLGTGSGCILVSLLAEAPMARGTAVDLSRSALDVARKNAASVGVASRTTFVVSDWFEQVEGRFDLIVSNPPYIDEAEWQTLEPEPRLWEPKSALTPGADGLVPYRIIAGHAGSYLTDGGRLLVEIGWQQGPMVARIFADAGFSEIQVLQDMDGRDRCVEGRLFQSALQK